MRAAFVVFLLGACATPVAPQAPSAFCSDPKSVLDEIATLRLSGDLDAALEKADTLVACAPGAQIVVAAQLERAAIHDRIGLHTNTRPVAAALAAIDAADDAAQDDASKAAVALAKADHYYRSEMADRRFEQAELFAEDAIKRFQALGDKHTEADAVHRLGLIQFQRRDTEPGPSHYLPLAQDLFDRSLRLDEEGGARAWFCGEYNRHVGFIHEVQGDLETALPLYRRSLECRIEAGATDAAMFAAITLASALVNTGRAADAAEHLDYAAEQAERIGSPVGRARLELVRGDMHLALGDKSAARAAYSNALDTAESVGSASMADRARDGLARSG